MKKVKKLIFSATAKDTTSLFIGNTTSSILAVVFVILVARYLGPKNLGIGMAVVSFVTILSAVGDLGLTSSLFRFVSKTFLQGDTQKAQKYLSFVFSIRFFSAVIIGLILILSSPFASRLIYKTNEPYLMILSALAIFGFLLWDFQIQSFQSKRRFLPSAIFIVLSNLLRVLLVVVFALTNTLTLFSAVLSFSLSPLLVFFVTLPFNKVRLSFDHEWKKLFFQIIPFSGWMGVTKTAGAISGRIDTLLLIQLLGAYEVGIYSASRQLAQGIPIFIGSFATVLAPRFASLEGVKLNRYYKKTIMLSILISTGVFIAAFAAPIVTILFGKDYASSVPIFRWLLIGFIPLTLSIPPVNLIIYAHHKPKIISTLTLIELPIIILGNILLIPVIGIYAPILVLGINHTLTMLVSFAYNYAYSKKN